tara:strand:+ start:191 stop:1468 length:1278 start_codon:yes stop_codon:yes gene_type:complete
MATRFNPFRPGQVVPPGLFCGRIDEVQAIDHCLSQTKFGNPRHFLLEGERGIGKSSLFFLEALVARGELESLSGASLNFIVLEISLEPQDTYVSLIKKISSELRNETLKRDKLKDLSLKAWELITRLEAGGVRIRRDDDRIDESLLLSNIQQDFIKIIKSLSLEDGILLLVDEADQPNINCHLGRFCKLLTESLTRANCDRLCIGLAGLPGLIVQLRESHESSPRLFETMDLQPLEEEERSEVITHGLNDAKEKNGYEVNITDKAKSLLCDLSEGYPHFLQEFCYCAFDADSDNVIDASDVASSLFTENGAFDQLGRKYFLQYYDAPASDDYRTVLNSMADHSDDWVDRKTIISESGIKSTIVDNALRALKGRNIIMQNTQRRGEYKLPTKSFSVWIKTKRIAEESADNAAPGLFEAGEDDNSGL